MKTAIITTLLGVLCLAASAHAQQAVQWKLSDGGNGHWYRLDGVLRSWEQAHLVAVASGGHLATIQNPAENALVVSLSTTPPPGMNRSCWLGGRQSPGSCEPGCGWGWVTGEPFDFQYWATGEPNNVTGSEDYLHIWVTDKWNDTNASYTSESVIEWDADCNGDGIVDYGQCHDGTLADYNGNNIPDCCEHGDACVVANYPVQWRVEDGGNGHWYQGIVPTPLVTWLDAKLRSESLGGHLVTFTSATEHQFVYWRIAQSPQIWHLHQTCGCLSIGPWIGMRRTTDWQWVTGEPVSFTSWHPSEPWEGSPYDFVRFFHYAAPLSPAPLWDNYLNGDDSEDISTPTSFIVEWDADCNHDGIVDYGQILLGQLADDNHDGIPDICQQPTCHDADLYPNGRVDGADLGILLSEWGPVNSTTHSDFNHDGRVDGSDLGFLLANWGPCQN